MQAQTYCNITDKPAVCSYQPKLTTGAILHGKTSIHVLGLGNEGKCGHLQNKVICTMYSLV